jgi:hypothetical protein
MGSAGAGWPGLPTSYAKIILDYLSRIREGGWPSSFAVGLKIPKKIPACSYVVAMVAMW